ncbi:MAG: DUF1819 family protein [Methanomicrobiales archaeon]|nr:DUF1819 family protein [Methanomicrobiales archaeon]
MAVLYTSKILKGSALIDDTILLLSSFDLLKSTKENISSVWEENILVKSSRSRLKDVLVILEERYLADPDLASALHRFVKMNISHEILYPILFFLTARSDPLIHDLFIDFVYEKKRMGMAFISTGEVDQVIQQYVKEGKTTTQWSPETTIRASQHFLALLRDFGILEGKGKKQFSPFIIPNESFSFLSLYLHKQGLIGQQLVTTDEWKLLFLEKDLVERFYVDCEQDGYLIYNAAWPVIRIDYPASSLAEYADVIINRTN